jgi:flagellar basal body-associated protein FliL
VSNHADRTEWSSRKRTWLITVVAVVVLAAVGIAVWVSTSGDDKKAGSSSGPIAKLGLVVNFSGRGDQTTKVFKVASNWEVKWRTQADKAFAVELLRKGGDSAGQIVVAKKQSAGSTFVSDAGDFKLAVSAAGKWSVQVYSRPTKK